MPQQKNQLMAHSSKITFGIFLVITGLLLYAKEVDWIDPAFPIWPVVFIAFGVVLVAGEMSK